MRYTSPQDWQEVFGGFASGKNRRTTYAPLPWIPGKKPGELLLRKIPWRICRKRPRNKDERLFARHYTLDSDNADEGYIRGKIQATKDAKILARGIANGVPLRPPDAAHLFEREERLQAQCEEREMRSWHNITGDERTRFFKDAEALYQQWCRDLDS